MRRFRASMRRAGHVIFPLGMLLTIVGFNGQPALWIPLVVVFIVIWIMGVRSDRKARQERPNRHRRDSN